MIKFKHFLLTVPLLAFCFLTSCKKDEVKIIEEGINTEEECAKESDLGTFYLLESSRKMIPYSEHVEKVIFSDSTGKEYTGEVISNRTIYYPRNSAEIYHCDFDSSLYISHNSKVEAKEFFLELKELDISISLSVRLLNSPKYSIKEQLFADYFKFTLKYPDPINSTYPTLNIITANRGHPNPSVTPNYLLVSPFFIHGRLFENVHMIRSEDVKEFDLYYNKEIGIVGFKNTDRSIDLKYERTE